LFALREFTREALNFLSPPVSPFPSPALAASEVLLFFPFRENAAITLFRQIFPSGASTTFPTIFLQPTVAIHGGVNFCQHSTPLLIGHVRVLLDPLFSFCRWVVWKTNIFESPFPCGGLSYRRSVVVLCLLLPDSPSRQPIPRTGGALTSFSPPPWLQYHAKSPPSAESLLSLFFKTPVFSSSPPSLFLVSAVRAPFLTLKLSFFPPNSLGFFFVAPPGGAFPVFPTSTFFLIKSQNC